MASLTIVTVTNVSGSCPFHFPVSHPFKNNVSFRTCFPLHVKRLRAVSTYCVLQPFEAPLETTDLKVTFHRSSLITPLEKIERKSMFLSNIDQSINNNIGMIFFFSKNLEFPSETLVLKLETSYRKVLVFYDFLAGRLGLNTKQGRLEIDCNSTGAGFVVASSELKLAELAVSAYPNPAFEQLAVTKGEAFPPEDPPLFFIQVTFFKCGGFALGISFNHITMDGISIKIFFENLASLATDNLLTLTPNNNRELLAARCPPRVTFPHPELLKLESSPQGNKSASSLPFQVTSHDLECKVFRLSPEDIINLKEKAKIGGEGSTRVSITSFNVVMAHVWRCKALATSTNNNLEKTSTVIFPVNIRSILQPRLPSSYTGNAIFSAYWTATCRELEEGPFSRIVQMISLAATRLKDEYIRSVIDWIELFKGYPNGDVIVTSWWKLGLGDVEYPWGKPKWFCPVVQNHWNKVIFLLPDIGEKKDEGVNIVVSLPHREMVKFQQLFNKY